MPTRFYLPASGATPVSPTVSAEWEHNNGVRRKMHPALTNTAFATTSYSPDAADHLVDGEAMVVQFVSDPLTAQTISAQTVAIQILLNEANASNNIFLTWKLFLCSRDGTSIGSTILAQRRDGTEIVAATNTNRSDSATSSSVSAALGDRIVLEIGYGGLPSASGGTQGHNGGIRFGDVVGTADLAVNDTDTTDANPWLEFANALSFELPIGQSTLDTRRPVQNLIKPRDLVYREYGANGILPESAPAARAQVSWVQIEAPESGVVVTLPPGQSTLDTRRPAGYLARAFRYPIYEASVLGNALIPELVGQDQMATGKQSVDLPPKPARRAGDYTWTQDLVPNLVGQDAVTAGAQRLELPPRAAARSRDYTYTDSFALTLIGQDATNAGAQSTALPPPPRPRASSLSDPGSNYTLALDAAAQAGNPQGKSALSSDLSPRAVGRSRDYSVTESFSLTLIGQDAMLAGDQHTALPPIAPARARDYSFTPPINLSTLTTVTQAIPDGKQLTDALPPRAASRARDYTWVQDLIPNLIGQDQMATGRQVFEVPRGPARAIELLTYLDASENWLFGTDAMLAGKQSTALPPIAALRARDYSFTPPVNLSCLTTVVQQIPYGLQLTDSLTPRAAARAREYTWTQDLIPNLIGQDERNAGDQLFDLAPSPAPLRARDYSISESFPLTLIGRDSMAAGAQRFELPPIGPLRARDYSFVPPINLSTLTTVVQQIPYGAQSTDTIPPRAPLRARDYTFLAETKRNLIGRDEMAAGDQSFDLPPRAAARASQLTDPGTNFTIRQDPPLPAGVQSTTLAPKGPLRARDYTHLNRLPNLIGQDAMTAGDSTHASELPPKGPQRARDYTWLQSFPLYIFEQLPPGRSTQRTEGPPPGPLRLRDYTHLDLTKQNLIGQDTMFGAPGQVPTYDWQLPTPAAPRLRDYTIVNWFDLSRLAAAAVPGHHTVTVGQVHAHTLSVGAVSTHTLTVGAVYMHTVSISEASL